MSLDLSHFGASPDDKINIAIIGANGGIGNVLIDKLSIHPKTQHIYALSRSSYTPKNNNTSFIQIDFAQESTIRDAAERIDNALDLIIIATGFLHDQNTSPEKSLRDLSPEGFYKNFLVNTIGPALIAKYLMPKFPRESRSIFAVLTARVGSISDNQVGGWYAYRASKAAMNMTIKNLAIEGARKFKNNAIVALHPGTVDTNLSRPFHANVGHEIFTPAQSAQYLLEVISKIAPHDTGRFFAWDAQEITP